MRHRKEVALFLFIGLVCGGTLVPFTLAKTQPSSPRVLRTAGWYYLPGYPNYAPQGLPDFDQKQDGWKQTHGKWRVIGGLYSFCAPSSLADIFWWFDSQHEIAGYPGDGNDSYPLVRDLNAPSVPTPGPHTDDHNFNNVNDPLTPWNSGKGDKELIETLAWYCNTNFCKHPLVRGYAGTQAKYLENGARQWIQDAGLQDYYTVEGVWHPSFQLIVSKLENNSGIILNLLLYNDKGVIFQTFLGHYVAVAGINPDGSIALSDPFQNKANPNPTPADHNDANVVSHDVYSVNFTCPFPDKASWWLENYFDFGPKQLGGIPWYAMIITEK